MIYLRYKNGNDYLNLRILNSYSLSYSNNEVTYSEITVDFYGHSIAEMPYKYQEVQITKDDEIQFIGYLDTLQISKMKCGDERCREMSLTLLSPLKMATIRTVSIVGKFPIKEAITRILAPLVADGFVIKEINTSDSYYPTINHVMQTVEYCMNDLSQIFGLYWYINNQKEIFVNSIVRMMNLNPKMVLETGNYPEGFLEIAPTINNTDYANIINFKNVRLFYDSEPIRFKGNLYPTVKVPKIVSAGNEVVFDNPVVVNEETLKARLQELKEEDSSITRVYGLFIENNSTTYSIYYDEGTGYKVSNNIRYSTDGDSESGKIILNVDSFYSNLVTGFTWNGTSTATFISIYSNTGLRMTDIKYMNSAEVEKQKGIISDSGIVEKIVDLNEKWMSINEVLNYGESLIVNNSNEVNEVQITVDKDPNIFFGEVIKINLPQFYTVGRYAVTGIDIFYNRGYTEWKITAKKWDALSNYYDIFRNPEKEENYESTNNFTFVEYVEQEQILETHEMGDAE